MVLQGAALYALAALPLVSFGWVYGRFTNRPDLEFFADHLNYKTSFFRRRLKYSEIEGLAFAQRGQSVRRATILFAKDHRHRVYPLFVPKVFVCGEEIVRQLERLTGRTTVTTKSSAEFRQWTKATDGPEVGDLTDADRLPAGAPDFDRLARAATAPDAGIDAKNRLWAAAFKLKAWHFIARGEIPNVGPYIASHPAIADGAPMLKAFTDPDRLRTFAQQCGLTAPDGIVLFLSLRVESILPTLESYTSQGVTHIHFNADECSHGFFIPLAQLPIVRRHLESQGFL
jgi:hypothetical protein